MNRQVTEEKCNGHSTYEDIRSISSRKNVKQNNNEIPFYLHRLRKKKGRSLTMPNVDKDIC